MKVHRHTLSKGSKVRHLLIEGDDPAKNTLSQLIDGVRTVIVEGTQYEVENKATH